MDEQLKEKIKQMTLKQRIAYFWDYHKWHVLLSCLIIIFLITFISSTIEERKPAALSVAIVNARNAATALELIQVDYPAAVGIDAKKTPVRVDAGFLHPKVMNEETAADTMVVASIQKYQAAAVNGYVDVAIAPTWAVAEYQKANVYEDLEQMLPKDFLEQYKDLLFYTENKDGKQVAAGIKLENTEVFGEFYEDGVAVMAICTYSEKKEEAKRFIEWMIKDSR